MNVTLTQPNQSLASYYSTLLYSKPHAPTRCWSCLQWLRERCARALSHLKDTHARRAAPRDGSRHQRRVPPAHRHVPPLHTASFCLGKWLRPRQKRSNQPPGASVSAPPSGTGRLSVEKIPGGLWLCLCLGGREESAAGGEGRQPLHFACFLPLHRLAQAKNRQA